MNSIRFSNRFWKKIAYPCALAISICGCSGPKTLRTSQLEIVDAAGTVVAKLRGNPNRAEGGALFQMFNSDGKVAVEITTEQKHGAYASFYSTNGARVLDFGLNQFNAAELQLWDINGRVNGIGAWADGDGGHIWLGSPSGSRIDIQTLKEIYRIEAASSNAAWMAPYTPRN